MPFRQITVIDCGACGTALGLFSLSQGGLRCDFLTSESLPGSANTNEQWLAETIAALRALGNKKERRGPAVVILPPHVVLLKHVQVPRVDAAKRGQVVRFEVEQAIPYPVGEVTWGTVACGESEATEALLLAAAKHDVVLPLCAAARSAGIEVVGVVPSVMAVRAVAELIRPVADERLLVLNTGLRAATLLQIDGTRFAARSWSIAASEAGKNIEIPATKLAQETTRALLHFRKHHKLESPVRTLALGDVAQRLEVAEALGVQLKLPVDVPPLLPAVGWSPEAASAAANFCGLPELVGAATLHLLPGHAAMDLMPVVLRRRARLRQIRPWVAAVLLVLGGLILPWMQYRRLLAVERETFTAFQETQARLRNRPVRELAEPVSSSVPESSAREEETASAVQATVVEPSVFRLRLSGYAGSAGDYLLMFVSPDFPGTLLARVGHRFDELGLVLRNFEVKKVLLEHDGPWPVYEVAGFATLFDEQSGIEVVLDSRSSEPIEESTHGISSFFASRGPDALNPGP